MDNQNFLIALEWVLAAEGVGIYPENPDGYVFDPADKGGETKFGISKRSYPHLNIKGLTLAQAEAIYLKDYWQRCNCDALPKDIAIAVFDAAVNHGVYRAAVMLQHLVEAKADGIIGSKTAACVSNYTTEYLLVAYLGRRADLYADIVAADSSQAKFRTGWFHRLFELQAFIKVVTLCAHIAKGDH